MERRPSPGSSGAIPPRGAPPTPAGGTAALASARPRLPLSPGRIGGEALAVIDEEGVPAFTLERLAARLGVKAPSLYNHVASKTAIVELVRDLVVDEMDYSMFGSQPWDTALEGFARSYRDAFARHPNTVALLYTTPVNAPGTYQMYEAVAAGLARAGWASRRIIPLLAALEYLIAGSVLDLTAQGTMFGDAAALGAETIAASHLSLGTQREAADESFELGLEALLVGLRTRYTADLADAD